MDASWRQLIPWASRPSTRRKARRAAGRGGPLVYRLDDGTEATLAQITADPRNEHRVPLETLRSRLNSGVTDPAQVFRPSHPGKRLSR